MSVGATGSSNLSQQPLVGQSPAALPAQPPASSASSSSKSVTVDAENASKARMNNKDVTVLMKVKRVSQRFLVLSPHAFLAMAITFVGLNLMATENLAYSGTTFVGVGATVFCLVRPIFREIIPYYMLPHNEHNRWRWIINLTWTGCITTIFTSAVWRLPDITATQGVIFLGLTFFAPYYHLSKMYPEDFYDQKDYLTLSNGA